MQAAPTVREVTVGGGKYKLTKDSSPYSQGSDCWRFEIEGTQFLSTEVRPADSDTVLKLIQKTIFWLLS